MWMRRVWGLVLSLFGGGGGLVSSIPSSGSLEHGHGSMSEAITLWATLIHFSEERERLEAIDRFFSTNASQLSSSLSCGSIWALTEGLSPSQKN